MTPKDSHGLSMGFSRPDYWGGLPFLSPGDLPDPGIERGSPALQADSVLSVPREALSPAKALSNAVWPESPFLLVLL